MTFHSIRRAPAPAGLLLVLAAACSGPSDQGTPPLLTALPRSLSPAEALTAQASNGFGFDLLRAAAARRSDSTYFLSPLSATMALSLALNGADGPTFEAMRTTLRLGDAPLADINAGAKGLLALLGTIDPTSRLTVANSVWLDQGAGFHPEYLAAARDWYDAEASTLDFSAPSAPAAINDWVSAETGGRIPRLLDQIEPSEIAFLINAVYFKGLWRHPFDPRKTGPGEFHAVDGDQSVSMMRLEPVEHAVAGDADVQVLEMLYGNGALVMTLVVPQPGRTLAEITATLDTARWNGWMRALQRQKVEVTMPRFRLELSRSLKDDLSLLGMGIAFDPVQADFSRMRPVSPSANVYLTRVLQKTFVEVNEEGTEAAAATSVGVGVTSAPPSVVIDRPFLVAIRERFAGTILFLGQVTRIP
ncbi:MAG TPA: serpin family protein [Gemmatimonadales bacterium]|nr:serpin family protein [Gemmatimonadales bacterium]